MKYSEPVPAALLNEVHARLSPGEEELIRVASDLTAEGKFGSQWLIATDRRVLLAPSADGSAIKEVLLQDVTGARTKSFVGGGCLQLEWNGGAPLSVGYSAALTHA